MEDDVYNGMFIPKGSIIVANTRFVQVSGWIYVPLFPVTGFDINLQSVESHLTKTFTRIHIHSIHHDTSGESLIQSGILALVDGKYVQFFRLPLYFTWSILIQYMSGTSPSWFKCMDSSGLHSCCVWYLSFESNGWNTYHSWGRILDRAYKVWRQQLIGVWVSWDKFYLIIVIPNHSNAW